jgi:hypothetical protein
MEGAFVCCSVLFLFSLRNLLSVCCLVSGLELSKGILSPRSLVCDLVPVLVVAIGIAYPCLPSSVPRLPTPVTLCLAIGYFEPLSSRLAPPLQRGRKPLLIADL